jgi:hypothetical protein
MGLFRWADFPKSVAFVAKATTDIGRDWFDGTTFATIFTQT